MDTLTSPSSPARRGPAVPALPLAVALFALGPVATVYSLQALAGGGLWLSAELLPGAALGALVGLWAPHPASLPALWMQSVRDATLPRHRGLFRALWLLPAMLLTPRAAAATAAQLVGFGAGVAAWLAVPA